jgi:hypothetical protein
MGTHTSRLKPLEHIEPLLISFLEYVPIIDTLRGFYRLNGLLRPFRQDP